MRLAALCRTRSLRCGSAAPLLPQVLAQMRLALPQVQVELVVSNAVSNLLRREAYIAVRMVAPDQTTVIAKRIGKVTLGIYAHRNYLRRRGAPKQAQDLASHALVGYDRDRAIINGFAAFGMPVERENFALRTDDLIAYQEAIRAGLGIGFLADYVARVDANLVPILPAIKLPPIPVWLAVHREIRTSQRIRQVFDFLAGAVPAAL
ncbi:MAG: hypothetical protein LH632_08425 [Rhodoferax sp.]|nr:hypothetical protein [Rhodoferax sp.]